MKRLSVAVALTAFLLGTAADLAAQRRGRRPGQGNGKIFRVIVEPGSAEGTLKFTCADSGADCERIEVDASDDARLNRVRWDFDFPNESITEVEVNFPQLTPFFERETGGNRRFRNHRNVRLTRGGPVMMQLKARGWEEDDVTEISGGDQFKYDIRVTTNRSGTQKTYFVDPMVIVRSSGP